MQYEGRDARHSARRLPPGVAIAEDAVRQCVVAGTAFESGALADNVAADADALMKLLEQRGLQARRASDADRSAAGDEALQVVVESDAAVVGSGAGGGVTAAALAASGVAVVVLEKGAYMHPAKIPDSDADAMRLSYESSALMSTYDTGALWPCLLTNCMSAQLESVRCICDECERFPAYACDCVSGSSSVCKNCCTLMCLPFYRRLDNPGGQRRGRRDPRELVCLVPHARPGARGVDCQARH
jgi:NAD(P)-binding Rossmann-like domain